MGKDSKKTYPAFANSPFGTFLSKIQAKLSQIRESRPATADDPVEKIYSDQQLAAIGQGFDFLIKTALPIFDAGNSPSLFSTALPGMISSGLGLRSFLPVFYTPEYAVYEAIEKDLEGMLTTWLETKRIKLFTPENIDNLRATLKVEIRKQKEIRFAAANKIPNNNLDLILAKLDGVIEKFNFIQFNQEKHIDKKKLITQLNFDIKKELIGWNHQFKDFNPPFQLKITDPGLYQLLVEFLLLVDTLPESLDACIPFLNPTALNLNLRSGIIAKLLSAAGLAPFQLASISNEESSSAYCYDLSIGEETISFNGDEHYREALPQSRVFLYALLNDYFAVYGETSHVKSERAKAKLIQDFITEETHWLQNKSKPYNERYQELNKSLPAEMGYEDKLNLLKQKMVAVNELLSDIEQLIEGVNSRNYQQQTFADLLVMHNMVGVLEADAALGLDVSYAVSALPAILVAEDQGSFTTIPVQQILQTKLYSTLNDLSRLRKQITDQQLDFARQDKLILQEWHEAVLKQHQKENERWLERLEHFRIEASGALRLDQIEMPDDGDNFELQIQSLSQELEDLTQCQEKLKKYESQLEILQEALNKPVPCPERLCQDDNRLIEAVEGCYTASKKKMSLCGQQLHESAKLFESRQEALEGQLRKIQAAKAFAEAMRSSNPEDIEILLSDKQEQLRELFVTQEKRAQDLSKKRLQLQQDEESPYGVDDEVLEEVEPLSTLVKKRNSIIQSILAEIAVHSKQILAVEPGFAAYFDVKKLNSLAGVDAAQRYLNKIFEDQRGLESVEESRDYPQMLAALNAAYNCINDSSKERFPFKTLTSLSALQGIVTSKNSGFEALLSLLDDSNTTKLWLAYSKSAPPKELLLQAREQLLKLIESKRWSYQSKIQGRLILEKAQKDFLHAQDSLLFIRDLMILLPVLNNDIEELVRKHREQKRSDLLLAIEQEELSLAEEEETAVSLTEDVSILQQVVDLLRGCQALNKLVAEVEASDTEFGSADLLYQNQEIINGRIARAVSQQGKLNLLLEKLARSVNSLNDNTAYLANIETIISLLQSSEQRILKFKDGIFGRKVNDLQAKIQANKEAMVVLGKKLAAQFTGQEVPLAVQLSRLDTLLIHYSNYADARALITKCQGAIQGDLQTVNAENLKIQFSLVNNNVQQLALSNEQSLVSYLNQVEEILKTYESDLQTHSTTVNVAFSETTECYHANRSIFADTENYLRKFPQTTLVGLVSTLEDLKPASEAVLHKLKAVCKASEALRDLLAQKQSINAALNARIEARKSFAVDFTAALDRYLVQRNGKYALKDYVLWTDGVARKQFVEQVTSALDAYTKSGNSEPLFTYINSQRGKFAGYNLQTILSQLLHGLSEQDKRIPKNYDDNKSEALIIEHQRALAALATFDAAGNNKEQFVKAIEQLYTEIEGIEQYGLKVSGLTDEQRKTILELAQSLRTKVDTFIISNQGRELTRQAVESFQTEFMHLAHTQDELMSKHASWWRPVLFNMFVAVTTLGIVVGLQLAASKWSTGRFAFFYDRSVGLERVGAVEKAAAAIAAPAA
ncbi:hypothetical protein [Legionella sp. 29fVS95]|uniref:hypothetical protein n=1 Tax=Legionella sp. 29fVS95 TaxID=3402813 RepID=UPI003AF91EFF